MRKILAIALSNLTRMSRDRSVLILFLLMPMLLIGILGISLKGITTAGRIEPFPVILVNDDRPAPDAPALWLGRVLVEEVFGSDRAQEVIKPEATNDLAAARERVSRGEAAAVVHIPAGYSAALLAGGRPEIRLYTDPGRPTQAAIVTQIVQAFSDQVSNGAVAAAVGEPVSAQAPVAIPRIRQQPSGVREVGAMAYYAAGMAVMYMFMSAIQRAKTLLQDQDEGLLSRLIITPTPRWQVMAGHMLATALLIGAQFLILLLGTRLLYGVVWGDWLAVLLIGLAFALAAAGLSTALAAVIRDQRAADAAVGLLGMLCGALSGSMFPLYAFPDGLRQVARLVPNYWALQGFLDQMAGLGLRHALLPVTILCLIGLATGALGAWRLSSDRR